MESKVGLLTFHRTNNFGSQLQALGLYLALQREGYICEIVDYRSEAIEQREFLAQRIPFCSMKTLIKKAILEPVLKRKAKAMRIFLEKHAQISRPYTRENIAQACQEYEKFLVGSDIVWGTDITEGDMTYFLDFVSPNKKKLAFASSVGTTQGNTAAPPIPALLRRFDKIYVREDDAVSWVKAVSGADADVVCDPTMLLSVEEWENVFQPKAYPSGYILAYFDDPNGKLLVDARAYAAARGLKVKYITYTMPPKGVEWVRPTTVEEFVGLIKHADAMFTASYHGLLFSLYYQRQVFFYNRAHKSRMRSLAQRLGIEDRCADQTMQEKQMNYDVINAQIATFRSESVHCLKKLMEES